MSETARIEKRFGLIGRKLGHSYSQRWFGELFARLGLHGYSYRLYEMESVEGLREWVKREGICGFNVTVPYKQAVIPHLDALDAVASKVGAVNCVTVEEGRLVGHNTDAPAFQQTLERVTSEEPRMTRPERAFILGTGGAARAVAFALDRLHIPCTFVSRFPEKRKTGGGKWEVIGYDELPTAHCPLPTLLVNATPVGMYPDADRSPLPFPTLQSLPLPSTPLLVYDLIYNPSPTLLMRQAAALGARTCDGLEMLCRQAELSWEMFRTCVRE